jgi:hypothetical protein
MRQILSIFLRSALLILCAATVSTTIYSQTTAFTYQGHLSDGSTAANGTYNVQLTLFDAATGGTQIGAPQTDTNVSVVNGAFTVQLDFGANSFASGANRFLEIAVKRPADANYTTLTPRQQLTSAPYSIRTLSASAADSLSSTCVGCVTNEQIAAVDGAKVTGTVSSATSAASATTATTANTATTATTASSVSSTSGNSVIAAINDAATTTTVSESRLPFTYFRLKPLSTQNSSSTNQSDAVFDVTGNLDDGNGNLTEKGRFRFNHNGGFLASGVYDGTSSIGIPAEGAGTRMMWYPEKAALRAGYVDGTQWDDANIGLYSMSFGYGVRSSGDYGLSAGYKTTAANTGSVALNMFSIATGYASVALGMGAHTNARYGSFVFADVQQFADAFCTTGSQTGCNSTEHYFRALIKNSFTARASNGYYLFTNSGITGTTGLRLGGPAITESGVSSFFNGSFVWTDRSIDTGITPTAQNQTIFRSSGGFTIYSNSGATSGVTLAPGAGTWSSLSDRNMKENFAAVNSRDILRRVLKLPISTWNYKTQDASIRHIGAMAQDFKAAFQVGENDKMISTIDPDGVTLAAIQGLNEELNEQTTKLKTENKALRAQIAAQNNRLAAQAAQLSEFEARLKRLEDASPRRIINRRKIK